MGHVILNPYTVSTMKNRTWLFFLTSLLVTGSCLAQSTKKSRLTNDFFVLHNAIRGDSTYKTFDEQVALIKDLGFDGVEINQLDSFDGLKAALDKHQFTGSYFYVKVNLDSPTLDPRLEPDIRCHWLATRNQPNTPDPTNWKALLTRLKPYLKMMTISGANDVDAAKLDNGPGGVWNQYIGIL